MSGNGETTRSGEDAAPHSPPTPPPAPASSAAGPATLERPPSSPRTNRPSLTDTAPLPKPNVDFNDQVRSPSAKPNVEGQLSPAAADRVFPIRSAISVDPTPTPSQRPDRHHDSYFGSAVYRRRQSINSTESTYSATPARNRQTKSDRKQSPRAGQAQGRANRKTSISAAPDSANGTPAPSEPPTPLQLRHEPQFFNQMMSTEDDNASEKGGSRSANGSTGPLSARSVSVMSLKSSQDETGGLVTARFKHVVTEGGHAIITGRDGETLQRCEDEPIHIPGAVQGFGLLIALEEQSEGRLVVRIVSENSKRMIGYTPRQLFALESFTDILSEEQADNLLDHIDFIRDEDADVMTNGPEVFTMSIRMPGRKNQKMWCAMHINDRHPHLVICEFELEDDPVNPLVPVSEMTPESPENTLDSQPTEEEYVESTQNASKPLRVLRSARKRKGEAAAMEVFNIMSQVQEQLAAAPTLETFLRVLVGVIKELTGFHRVMVYQFDSQWNGRVVTELVDPRATKDLYKGLNFPASDIPKQARELYKINKVRMLYDRDQETARLVCRTLEDLEQPLDLTYSYLRAMSPIHIKYLTNMAVRSSMSISINAFAELWGLISCHGYGSKGMRVSFPIRKMCRLVGDSASRNIERLSYASRLQARKLINTVPTSNNPSGYIIASSEDLLKLFDADFGLLSIRDETKILGHLEQSQEALAMLEYLRMRSITNVMTSQDITQDFPDLRYAPGFTAIAGLLLVPLSVGGSDFIVFFRKGQMKEVKWAGNPYEKFIKEGTEGYLEPRKSFRTWSETVVGKCREWTEEEIETAAVLCLVYGKFIEVWRQKEAALQNSQLTRLLLANSAHEVRTPLNAIINYLEIALEGSLDQETRDNLAKSHSASKSLIYVINDLLDLTKTEEGGELTKDEIFDIQATLIEATDMFRGDARRKGLTYEVVDLPGLPKQVIGDQRRVRQAISNITANAIQATSKGGIKVEMYVTKMEEDRCDIEISIADTGVGMNAKKLDALFQELEQVQSESDSPEIDAVLPDQKQIESATKAEGNRTLGLGLAVVARIVRNMNGQLRLKSEEGKGSRFVIAFPFTIPPQEEDGKLPPPPANKALEDAQEGSVGSVTPHVENQKQFLNEAPSTPKTGPSGEVTLIESSSSRRGSSAEQHSLKGLSRQNSGGSMRSRRSIGSARSGKSNISNFSQRSGKSEADRLIEAIQEPRRVEGMSRHGSRSTSLVGGSSRPKLEKRHTTAGGEPVGSPTARNSGSPEVDRPLSSREARPGELVVEGQGQPIRPVRIPDEFIVSPGGTPQAAGSTNADAALRTDHAQLPETSEQAPSTDHMRVLVAEDDPVNSRIIKKRLEKLGHDVYLTVNGEECSSTYCDKSGFFDIILMDMQMPIVDGLTSAKMIRSFEKSHPAHMLSTRASLNGRVPIIAVSASLVEKERQVYIDGGFDGWILKPISFHRLLEIMTGIVDKTARKENLYANGKWEQGGWFDEAQKDIFDTNTKTDAQPPTSAPDHEADSAGVKIAAAADDPFVEEEGFSEESKEQTRLAAEQERKASKAPKAYSMPALGSKGFDGGDDKKEESRDSNTTITQEERSSSPRPITPGEAEG